MDITNTLMALKQLNRDGGIIEARILKTDKGTVSGYYDNHDKLIDDVTQYDGKYAIYVTMNEIKPELLNRSANCLKPYVRATTSDSDIIRIKHILIDFDPIRKSGVSATDEEKESAWTLVEKVYAFLLESGFPEGIICDSGNGYHLLLAVNLENTREVVSIIKNFLLALDMMFSNNAVAIDRTTYNPSRITKLYGTVAPKGQNTEDRPHRTSYMGEIPKELELVSLEKLQSIANQYTSLEKTRTKPSNGLTIDVDAFIERNGLDLAFKGDFHGKGTKYILKTCRWNSDHTNSAAYIIQFNNGGIAAGCHHDSCCGNDFKALLKKTGETNLLSKRSTESEENSNKSPDIILMEIIEDIRVFQNEVNDFFVVIESGVIKKVIGLESDDFKHILVKRFKDLVGYGPSDQAVKRTLAVMKAEAHHHGEVFPLAKRIARIEDKILYDLTDKTWEVVSIGAEGCEIIDSSQIAFIRKNGMLPQVRPNFEGDPLALKRLLKKYLNVKNEVDLDLLVVHLVTSFVPEINHVLLMIHGEKGASKSTVMKVFKRLIDPNVRELLATPATEGDLVITLSNSYLTTYDNLSHITEDMANKLCMSVTGGTISKRKLYTDSTEVVINFKGAAILNGINVVTLQSDVLDRSIMIELARISFEERKTEEEYWSEFEKDRPLILGSIFNTLSKAMNILPNVSLKTLSRMADYERYGFAIAEATGIGGENFLKAYRNNMRKASEESVLSNPISSSIIKLMKGKEHWKGTPAQLYHKVTSIAQDAVGFSRFRWPNGEAAFSRSLSKIKSDLETMGITFERMSSGQRVITIFNNGSFIEKIPSKEEKKASDELSQLFLNSFEEFLFITFSYRLYRLYRPCRKC